MNRTIAIISSLSLAFFLTGGILGNADMRSIAAQTSDVLNIGPPQKQTFPLDSQQQPTILPDAKKQQLMDANHPSPSLPASGQPILGPVPGTQVSP
jgi:hypothetical protein